MRERSLTLGMVAWTLLGAGAPAAVAAPLETTEDIQACARHNLPQQTSMQHVEIESEDRVGARRKLEARVYWKRFEEHPRVMIKVDEPSEVRDAAYLAIEADEGEDETIYMYLPALKNIRRVSAKTAADSLWETDFSYEDMKYLQGVALRGSQKRLPDAEVEGHPVYVLEVVPASSTPSAYERVVVFLDQETCIPLRTEFYENGDRPRKVLSASIDSIREEGTRWSAREYSMRDLKTETRTWLRVTKSEIDSDLPDRLFNPNRLDRVR
jgi:hypothetical protein